MLFSASYLALYAIATCLFLEQANTILEQRSAVFQVPVAERLREKVNKVLVEASTTLVEFKLIEACLLSKRQPDNAIELVNKVMGELGNEGSLVSADAVEPNTWHYACAVTTKSKLV